MKVYEITILDNESVKTEAEWREADHILNGCRFEFTLASALRKARWLSKRLGFKMRVQMKTRKNQKTCRYWVVGKYRIKGA